MLAMSDVKIMPFSTKFVNMRLVEILLSTFKIRIKVLKLLSLESQMLYKISNHILRNKSSF